MDQNPRRNIFAKAKIEEPNLNLNLRLPKELFPKPDSDLCYVKIFGSMEKFVQYSRDFCYDNINSRKAQQGGETFASGARLNRKVYRIRNKELITAIGYNFERINEIQRASKATIGILADAESNHLSHSFLDLVGTFEQVKIAEELILDEVLKTYSRLFFPVILMPPIIHRSDIAIPLHKVSQVLGKYNTNLLRMEMESRAWIKIREPSTSSVGSELRIVNVFGPRENVDKAKLLIQSVISSEHEESTAKVSDKLVHKFKEPSCVELIDGKISYGDGESEEKKMHKLKGKEKAEERGPTSASGCYGSSLYGLSHVWKRY